MDVNIIRVSLLECYRRYGEKLVSVLKTAIGIAKENRLRGGQLPGDFDYRSLVDGLSSIGFQYNPSLLLRSLEREYGVIETSYRSSNQHWYRFRDLEAVEQALNSIIGLDNVDEDPEIAMVKIQIKALGANRVQFVFFILREARLSLFASAMAGFGGVISEVGASMMVGGNIKGYTRVLTTATVLETSRGNFHMAMALGVILFLLTFSINQILTAIQQREKKE